MIYFQITKLTSLYIFIYYHFKENHTLFHIKYIIFIIILSETKYINIYLLTVATKTFISLLIFVSVGLLINFYLN
jgi:hypothetical protein